MSKPSAEVHAGTLSRLIQALTWGAMAYRLDGRTLNRTFDKFDHPTLPQFIQLYK